MSSRPSVSTAIWRLRPLIFLPASYARIRRRRLHRLTVPTGCGFSQSREFVCKRCSCGLFNDSDRSGQKSNFFVGQNGEKPTMAVDSDEIEFRAVPAICLAASYRWEPRPGAETHLAYSLQLHFTIALSGVSVERTADRKRSRRSCRNSLHAHL